MLDWLFDWLVGCLADWLIGLWQVVKSYEDCDSVNHEGVLEVGRLRSNTVQQLVTELISRMDINNNTNDAVWTHINIHTVYIFDCCIYIIFTELSPIFYYHPSFSFFTFAVIKTLFISTWCLKTLYQGKFECKYSFMIFYVNPTD